MEGQFKWCIYNLFSSPLNPCQPKNMLEVVETPTSFAKIRRNPRLIDLFSPKVEIRPSKSRAANNKDSELAPRLSSLSVNEAKKVKKKKKKKKEDKNSSSSGNNNRRFSTSRRPDMNLYGKNNNRVTFSSSSSRESNNYGWFSSEDDYYSGRRVQGRRSKSDFYEKPPRVLPRQKKPGRRKEEEDGVKHHRCCTKGGSEESVGSTSTTNDVKYNLGGVVADESFVHLKNTTNKNEEEQFKAVEKSSRDPYKDFRASMVEMIVEKQISRADELEQLLLCFLSLNSTYHHKIIVQVFSEILEALFH